MKLTVLQDAGQAAKAAASRMAEQIRSKPKSVLGLATGGTMEPVYEAFLRHETKGLDLTQIRSFNLDEYIGLPVSVRRRIEPDLEFWSSAQTANNGDLVNAPSGRPFVQVEVAFLSQAPDAATIVRNMRIEFSAPQITDQVVGEIAPAVDVIAGRDTSFVLALQASLGAENNGFNRLQVFTPARTEAIKRHHEERLASVKTISREIGPACVEAFTQRLFKRRSWGPMADSETYAHLEHLRIAGQAERTLEKDGSFLYEAG